MTKRKYDAVKKEFDKYFVDQRHVLFEVCRFRKARQEQDETAEAFIARLYGLSEHCGFDERRDKEILYQLLIGMKDDRLSKKLQLEDDKDLTLEKARRSIRLNEEISSQQAIVRDSSAPGKLAPPATAELEPVTQEPPSSRRFAKGHTSRNHKGKQPPQQGATPPADQCKRCGKRPGHPRSSCPAANATCAKCKLVGHYARECQTKTVSAISAATGESSENSGTQDQKHDYFLGVIETRNKTDLAWIADVSVDGETVLFKIDTGADLTVIPERVYQNSPWPALTASPIRLSLADASSKTTLGKFSATMAYGGQESVQEIYVLRGLQRPLLGQPAIDALDVVRRIHEATTSFDARREFPKLFSGLGLFAGEHTIRLKDGAIPFALSTPRRVPHPLRAAVKEELDRMVEADVIFKVEGPTEWCAGMVVRPKPNGRVRVCVHLIRLNDVVRRERFILPSVEHTLAQLHAATVFSKLDANRGFHQIKLARESALLTTFITPFGRFAYNRLPFGITSAPEYFQKKMYEILDGLPGVICLMDDCLVFGSSQAEHDERLKALCARLEATGVTLNEGKCVFSVNEVKFLGQIVDTSGVRPDPEKLKAIRNLPARTDIHGARRLLGMTNHIGKFIPNLANLTEPIRSLLSARNTWQWGEPQQRAFDCIKAALTSTPVLAHYSPNSETIVSADASSFGLGAVLLQRDQQGNLRPVAYASCSLSPTEQRYAQIEKEALVLAWACDRFADYLTGMPKFHIFTDHKPLVPLLSPQKRLDELPPRVLRFRLRLAKFNFMISHVPGKQMHTADTLSRAPLAGTDANVLELVADADQFAWNLPVRGETKDVVLGNVKREQEKDDICNLLTQFSLHGWPHTSTLSQEMKTYLPFAQDITVFQGLLLKDDRLVIPKSLRREMLERVHVGHLGIRKCQERVKVAMWWPTISSDVKKLVEGCDTCSIARGNRPEPLLKTATPDYPWQIVGTDLFELWGKQYLLMVDYLSRYPGNFSLRVDGLREHYSAPEINFCKTWNSGDSTI